MRDIVVAGDVILVLRGAEFDLFGLGKAEGELTDVEEIGDELLLEAAVAAVDVVAGGGGRGGDGEGPVQRAQ